MGIDNTTVMFAVKLHVHGRIFESLVSCLILNNGFWWNMFTFAVKKLDSMCWFFHRRRRWTT